MKHHRNRLWRSILSFLMTVGWMMLIFLFSAQNGEELGDLSRIIAEPLAKLMSFLIGDRNPLQFESMNTAADGLVRCAAHFCEYTVLGGLLAVFFRCLRVRTICVPWLTGFLYAMSDEWHQAYIPGRVCDGMDLLIDGLGVIAGIIICKVIIERWRKKKCIGFLNCTT